MLHESSVSIPCARTCTHEVLDNFHRPLHRLDFRKQFVLFPVALLKEIVDVELLFKSRAMVVDVLDGFPLD